MTIVKHLLLVAALLILAVHSPGRSAPSQGKFMDFTLTLATPQVRYVELQPIPLVITLKNETNETLMGHTVLDFSSGYLQVYVDRGAGPQKIEELSVVQALVRTTSREFKPGEEVTTTESLNLKLDKIFSKHGTYKLQARLTSSDGKETISSKPIKVEIVQPEGMDAQALEFIRANDEPGYFFAGPLAMEKPEKLQVLENFVAIFGETAYGNDASFRLGQVHAAKHEYQKARKLFEKLSKKSDYAFAGEATEYLKQIEREEKKKDRP